MLNDICILEVLSSGECRLTGYSPTYAVMLPKFWLIGRTISRAGHMPGKLGMGCDRCGAKLIIEGPTSFS